MLVILSLLATIGALLYAYIHWTYGYWKRQGIPYLEPQIPFGCLTQVSQQKQSLGMAIYDCYKASKEKVVGIYLVTRPALLVRDAQLARDMLNKDFMSFHDRGIYIDEEHDPMSVGLLSMTGLKWKNMRAKLTPTFTSGKLRGMFGIVNDVGDKLVEHLMRQTPEEGSALIEMKHIVKMYAIDIIGSVIFGLEVNSFEDPHNDFYAVSKTVNHPSYVAAMRGACQFLYPNLEKFFNRIGWREPAPEAMKKLVLDTIEFRERTNYQRKDMVQLLLQLRNQGRVSENDNNWSAEADKNATKHMSPEIIAGQLFIFYVAGYETTASTTSFTLYELSQYPEILAKVQQDVDEALAKHGGSLTYEALKDMKYLELCIMETIRKYPALPLFNRECTKDYVIPETGKVIRKGTPVVISVFGIYRDPEYYPDPLVYSPERFLDESRNYDPVAYMPFGDGPRYCIGKRMGMVNVKMALAKVLTNFDIEVRPEKVEIEIDNYGVPIQPKGGVNVGLARKKKKPSSNL